ncbi:MAG: hypothetical protein ACOC9Y_02735 [Chloroflexota bacterium]
MALSYVYILASSDRRKLLAGLTSMIRETVWRSKQEEGEDAVRLVHLETYDQPAQAVARSDELQLLSHEDLSSLVSQKNPDWRDLSDGWFDRQACE